jgi:hypothetical protein|tara:strand:+ start:3026 stop:3346 length:321 start_codon:yes stop_codon:yes gene_type:complete
MPLFPDEELPTIGFRGNQKIVIPQNVDYINKLKADIEQLEEQIEVLSQKIPDATFKGTPHDLLVLLLDIKSLSDRLTSKQSHLIRSLSDRLQSESNRLDRMLGVSK